MTGYNNAIKELRDYATSKDDNECGHTCATNSGQHYQKFQNPSNLSFEPFTLDQSESCVSICSQYFLDITDAFLSLFVISPLVVAYWHGTWKFMERHPEWFPPLSSCLFGILLYLTIVLIREYSLNQYEVSKNTNQSVRAQFIRRISTKLHAYIFSIACILNWQGFWAALDIYYGKEFWPVLIMTSICLFGLLCTKSVRNLMAAPVVLLTDTKEYSFGFPMRFRYEGTQEPGLFILDCVFSVLVIGTLVVIVWRGMWVLCDMLIYPDNKVLAGWAALAIGYGIVAMTFLLQPMMRWACDRLSGLLRIAVADIFLFFSFVGTINVWRGFWGLLDVYLLPENPILGDILSHFAGFLLLALLNCSNSVLVRGVYIDAEEPAGQCVIFPIYYVRLFFQKERTKKQRRLKDGLDSALESQHEKALLGDGVGGKQHPIIVAKNNNSNSIKSIELNAILDEVTNVDEVKLQQQQQQQQQQQPQQQQQQQQHNQEQQNTTNITMMAT